MEEIVFDPAAAVGVDIELTPQDFLRPNPQSSGRHDRAASEAPESEHGTVKSWAQVWDLRNQNFRDRVAAAAALDHERRASAAALERQAETIVSNLMAAGFSREQALGFTGVPRA